MVENSWLWLLYLLVLYLSLLSDPLQILARSFGLFLIFISILSWYLNQEIRWRENWFKFLMEKTHLYFNLLLLQLLSQLHSLCNFQWHTQLISHFFNNIILRSSARPTQTSFLLFTELKRQQMIIFVMIWSPKWAIQWELKFLTSVTPIIVQKIGKILVILHFC